MGRVDDVINVAGHRLSTMEVESALVSHPKVAEAAVVGRPGRAEGPGDRRVRDAALGRRRRRRARRRSCASTWRTQIGALARPEEIRFTDALPKTRSGKIMRRLLREVASGTQVARRHDDARGSGRARAARAVVRARRVGALTARPTWRTRGRAPAPARSPRPRPRRSASRVRARDGSAVGTFAVFAR